MKAKRSPDIRQFETRSRSYKIGYYCGKLVKVIVFVLLIVLVFSLNPDT